MRARTILNATLGLIAAATLTSCVEAGPSIDDIVSTPAQVMLTPMPGSDRPSSEDNPFIRDIIYDANSSFSMLTEPVEDFRGTVVQSDLYEVGLKGYGSYEESYAFSKPFGHLVVRDQYGELTYLIYPAEKVFPIGQEINIERYWKLREDLPLMNNMLAYMISPIESDPENYLQRSDFSIESMAEDGHFDGIIELGAVKYIKSEE